MELNLIRTTYDGLNGGARCILALQNEPFFFIRIRGDLYMNKSMKGVRKITEAVRVMWQYDYMANQEIMDEVDAAYDVVRQVAGDRAASQLLKAWSEAADESRKAKAVAEARAWISSTLEAMTDEDWDELADAGYNSTFVDHGLFRAYSDLYDENKDHPAYRDWIANARRAACVYGFYLAKAVATKEPKTPEDEYRHFIKKYVDEITDVEDLRHIYTIASVRHEKVEQGVIA